MILCPFHTCKTVDWWLMLLVCVGGRMLTISQKFRFLFANEMKKKKCTSHNSCHYNRLSQNKGQQKPQLRKVDIQDYLFIYYFAQKPLGGGGGGDGDGGRRWRQGGIKKQMLKAFWQRCYYPHWSIDALSPVWGIFYILFTLLTSYFCLIPTKISNKMKLWSELQTRQMLWFST